MTFQRNYMQQISWVNPNLCERLILKIFLKITVKVKPIIIVLNSKFNTFVLSSLNILFLKLFSCWQQSRLDKPDFVNFSLSGFNIFSNLYSSFVSPSFINHVRICTQSPFFYLLLLFTLYLSPPHLVFHLHLQINSNQSINQSNFSTRCPVLFHY